MTYTDEQRLADQKGQLTNPIRDDDVCQWFALCDRPATHAEPHPVLGSVPACDRCPEIGQ